MTMISSIQAGRCDMQIDALKAEFGGILARRILEAEAVDFLWDARVGERYLGERIGSGIECDEADRELSRIAILSVLDGDWHVAMCLVDHEGAAVELLWQQQFEGTDEAEIAFRQVR